MNWSNREFFVPENLAGTNIDDIVMLMTLWSLPIWDIYGGMISLTTFFLMLVTNSWSFFAKSQSFTLFYKIYHQHLNSVTYISNLTNIRHQDACNQDACNRDACNRHQDACNNFSWWLTETKFFRVIDPFGYPVVCARGRVLAFFQHFSCWTQFLIWFA